MPSHGTVPRTCQICGVQFFTVASVVAKGAAKYCSRKCAHQAPPRRSLAERFWSHVNICGPINPFCADLEQCWVWTASLDRRGYGKFGMPGKVWHTASHIAYELQIGPVPPGFLVCHHCDYPRCVRGSHLFLGRAIENTADMMAKGRHGLVNVAGVRNPNARLTEGDVRAIRAAYANLAGTLAERYGVTVTAIRAIWHRKAWRELEEISA